MAETQPDLAVTDAPAEVAAVSETPLAEIAVAEVAAEVPVAEPAVAVIATPVAPAEAAPVKRGRGRPRKGTQVAVPVAAIAKAPAAAKPVTPKAVAAKVAAKPQPKAANPAKTATAVKAKAVAKPAKVVAPKLTVKRTAAPKATAPQKETVKMATKTKTPEITAKIQETFKDATEKAKAAFEKSQAAFGDAGEFAKGNVEAVVSSTKILAAGVKTMGETYVAETKSAYETMTADMKELAAVKSPTEFFELQSKLLRKNFDAAVATGSKKSEETLKLVNEAFQPISTRLSLAMEKIKQAA
jgi:phasin family protein